MNKKKGIIIILLIASYILLFGLLVNTLSLNNGLENEVEDLKEKLKDDDESVNQLKKAYDTHLKYLEDKYKDNKASRTDDN